MVPFTAGCLWTERGLAPEHVSTLFLQVAAILPLLGLGICIVFWNDVRDEVRRRGFFGSPEQNTGVMLDVTSCKS
jgi:hypothetical protein